MSDYFIADDLSGALDAAGAFHRAGRKVIIAMSADAWPEMTEDDVVGITTETRNAAPEVAAAAVARAIAVGRMRGAQLVYKKIDSTLRGPVAAEMTALAEQLPGVRILFAPANPGVGRTVRGGVLLVRGVPVAETEFGRDPMSPVRESDIRLLLGASAPARTEIADADSEADLAAAVARMDEQGGPWVAVGSGALARPVAARHERRAALRSSQAEEASSVRDTLKPGPASGSCLAICGSAHAGNRAQAALLAEERKVSLIEVKLAAAPAAKDSAIAAIQGGKGAALIIEAERRDSKTVVRELATTAAAIIAATQVRRVFVTGGETAFALCRKLGISRLTFRAELESGLSLASAAAADGPLLMAIKPGGFGDAHTWVRAWDRLVAENFGYSG